MGLSGLDDLPVSVYYYYSSVLEHEDDGEIIPKYHPIIPAWWREERRYAFDNSQACFFFHSYPSGSECTYFFFCNLVPFCYSSKGSMYDGSMDG